MTDAGRARGAGGPGDSDYLLIAEVDRPHGLRGEVVVTVHADDPARMARLASVFVRDHAGRLKEVAIEGVKRLRTRAVLKLSGSGSLEEARSLVGKELFIPRGASTPAPEGRYYAYQLIGLVALLEDGTRLGRVREVLRQGAQSLLVVEGERGELLVPFVPSICTEVDLDRAVLTLDPPEGLVELNAGRPAGPARSARRGRGRKR